jgi:nucleolar GTP-binding protein
MNFQKIPKVENADFFLDVAFRRANEESSKERGKNLKGDKLQKSRKIEIRKLDTINEILSEKLFKIISDFPNIDKLPEFYIALIKSTLDYALLKKSLGAILWAKEKVNEFTKKYKDRIRRTPQLGQINQIRREYYGRISSVVKQVKKPLIYLENARRTLKNYPDIKDRMNTIAIAGFPNTGKTTLLFKLTGSRPEIASYAFTTKGINVGYIEKKGKDKRKEGSMQFIDTPGTLNRFDTMNIFERQAYLAVKLLADKIIYVFDLTEPFPLEDQEKLYREMKKFSKQMIVYLSKTDIMDKEKYEEFAKRYDAVIDPEKLEKAIS